MKVTNLKWTTVGRINNTITYSASDMTLTAHTSVNICTIQKSDCLLVLVLNNDEITKVSTFGDVALLRGSRYEDLKWDTLPCIDTLLACIVQIAIRL